MTDSTQFNYRPNLESVQLCLENYVRLMDDAEKVSSETQFALYELALEELTKAWMLYFSYFMSLVRSQSDKEAFFKAYFKEVNITESTLSKVLSPQTFQASNLPKEGIHSFISLSQKLYEPDISSAFKTHSTKLKYLANLLRYLKLMLTIFKDEPNYKPSDRNKLVGKYMKVKEVDETRKRTVFENVISIIDRFDIEKEDTNFEKLELLQRKKEEAFYTSIYGDTLITPRTRWFNNSDIKALNDLLYTELVDEINVFIDTILHK